MAIRRETISVTGAAGGAGVATAFAYSTKVVTGVIIAIYLSYQDSPPATTDVTIEEAHQSPAMPILTVSDANTSGWKYPAVTNEAGGTQSPFVSDHIKVTLAQANNGDGVNVTIVWMEGMH